jgi:hypothetical protein
MKPRDTPVSACRLPRQAFRVHTPPAFGICHVVSRAETTCHPSTHAPQFQPMADYVPPCFDRPG